MPKALTLYKEGQRLNSESFLLDDEEVDNDDEVDDIGDPYDYLAFLFMSCLERSSHTKTWEASGK